MKTKVLTNWLIVAIIIGLGLSCSKITKEYKIPVTSKSDKAMDLYNEALEYMDKAHVTNVFKLLEQALDEDTSFFMASNNLAFMHMQIGNHNEFEKYAKQAVQSNARLSDGEELMKEALEKLVNNPKADVTEFGLKLVEQYPNDFLSYQILAFYQGLVNNFEGQVETFTKAIEIKEDPASIYNWLGNIYMRWKITVRQPQPLISILN